MQLQLVFDPSLSPALCDTYTLCASVDLMVRGVHCCQLNECTLEFDSAKDLTYATLLLSSSAVYTVRSV